MERGLDQLGMLGVSMTCSCFDRSTAEAEFEPLYEEMNRRGAVLNYHPIQNGICSPMINDYRFTVSVGASLEDSAIVLHLIARRVPERYPNIKYVVPHLGGIIPMLLQRLDNQAPSQHPDLPERPSVTARRFYYDTVGHGSQAALLCAWKAFGADHLVAGSDYPVLLAFETYRQTFHYIRECRPAGRGRRQDPQPQRPDTPGPRALTVPVRRRPDGLSASVANTALTTRTVMGTPRASYDAFPIAFSRSDSGTMRPCRGRIWSTASLSRSMLSCRFTCTGLGCAGGGVLGAAGV